MNTIRKLFNIAHATLAIGLSPVLVVLTLVGFTAGLLFGALKAGFMDSQP